MEIRHLPADDLALIGDIDRSEDIDLAYSVESGELASFPVQWLVPNWDPLGPGEHSVAHQIETWRPVLERGGVLLGAFDGETLAGLAIVEPAFEPGMAWLAFLHVGRPHRRRGAGTALWTEAEHIATASGAETMYVSSMPSASAVGFYLSRDCVLASPPHAVLYAMEPEDIHLIRSL